MIRQQVQAMLVNWTSRHRGAGFSAAGFPKGTWAQLTTGGRCSSLESEQRELSNARNPCDDLTRGKSPKIVNQSPPAFARRSGLRLGKPRRTFDGGRQAIYKRATEIVSRLRTF
jgi:hypothetical protein